MATFSFFRASSASCAALSAVSRASCAACASADKVAEPATEGDLRCGAGGGATGVV